MHVINPAAWLVIQCAFGVGGFFLVCYAAVWLRRGRRGPLLWTVPLALLCAFVDSAVAESASAPGLSAASRHGHLWAGLGQHALWYVLAFALVYAASWRGPAGVTRLTSRPSR